MGKIRKTLKLAIYISLAVGLLLSGIAMASPQEKITISLWTHDNLYVKFFNARAVEWAKMHPEYKFKFDFIQIPGDSLWPKVLTSMAAGVGAPDLVGIEISQFSRFMKRDIAETELVDLTPLVGEEREKFVRWEPYMHKGKLYGVESALCPVVYYYRDDIFKAAGIEMPLETWDDFVVAGRKLREEGRFMAGIDPNSYTHFMELLQQRGELLFDEKGSLMAPDNPKAIETLKFLVDGVKEKILWASRAFYGAPHFAALKGNTVVGDFMPDWWSIYFLEAQVPEQKGKWRIQLLPAWEPGGIRSSTWGGTGFAITSQSKYPKLVYDLLHFTYLTKENQIKRFFEIGYFPHMLEAMKDPRVINFSNPYYGEQVIGAVFGEAALQIPIQYQSPYWSEAETLMINEAITPAIAGKKTPQQGIKDAVFKIKDLMEKGY